MNNLLGNVLFLAQVAEGRAVAVEGPAGEWFTLVDAAKACGTCPPDLAEHSPDFVVLSFYKIFGYPTGIGALLIHKRAAGILRRRYFGGGTVEAVAADADFLRRRPGAAGLEDGTLNFLALPALAHGFERIRKLGGFPAVEAHTHALASYLVSWLRELRHGSGSPAAHVYGWQGAGAGGRAEAPGQGPGGQGPVVAFNLRRPSGKWVGCREVERMAALEGIRLRTGCFCNPGACALHLGLDAKTVERNHSAGHVCWDDNDLIDGHPTGAVRSSFGWMSSFADLTAFQDFIAKYFLQADGLPAPSAAALPPTVLAGQPRLASILVYPVKSLGPVAVEAWPVGPAGLLHDRRWAVLSEDGTVLTQKKLPSMSRVRPAMDLAAGTLTLTMPGVMPTPLVIRLPGISGTNQDSDGERPRGSVTVHLCSERQCEATLGQAVDGSHSSASAWLSQALGIRCRLAFDEKEGSRQAIDGASISYANEGQLLVMSSISLNDLNRRIAERAATIKEAKAGAVPMQLTAERFRPNLVVGGPGLEPYAEDTWQRASVGDVELRMAGPCQRCSMVCVNPEAGRREGAEPLRTLASYRRRHGQITFGVLMTVSGRIAGDSLLAVGADNRPEPLLLRVGTRLLVHESS
mmetsp:Transcript_26223/g.73513  ORF Transcript_26223/g.73513 Transcript_26223/m.73513 type:complete len:633 (-) Transcript_26223:588-2486(-)